MNYAPLARIILRYVGGGFVFGSQQMGERLAADPDAVMIAGLTIGAGVEGFYWMAKRFGWTT